jgi:ADP-ribosylglycohydrolase
MPDMSGRERATRATWKRQSPPDRTATLPVDISCTAEEFERLRYGFVPQVMEEKWFVYADHRTLHFHRSWTGFWIASLAFARDGDRYVAREARVNREASQYTGDDRHDPTLLRDLVRMVIAENEGWPAWRAEAGYVRRPPDLPALVRDGSIRMRWSDVLLGEPGPLTPETTFDRVEGMLLGLAIGDALGNVTEGSLPAARLRVEGYAPNPWAGGRAVGMPSDDTQLAYWTLEQLVADGGLDPERLSRRLSCQRIFGIGRTVRQFIANYKERGDWLTSGVASAGNGALMRIAPVLMPHLRHPTPRLWADAALAGMITHNDFASNAVCVAFVRLLWEALRLASPPPPGWWLRGFVEVAQPLEGENTLEPRCGRWQRRYRGPLTEFTDLVVTEALSGGLTAREACDRWGSGAFLLETVPSVLFILERYAASPRDAILAAVNDTVDNDTVAAIVGAAVGALHGRRALPEEWVRGLLGRTAEADDGYAFDLIEWARLRFWDPPAA